MAHFLFRLNAVFIMYLTWVIPALAAQNTAEYQILATTMGGFQGMQAPFTLQLDARGTPAPGGAEQAKHAIPAGMKMGRELPLIRPARQPAEPSAAGVPEGQENWTLKIYWGSSKTVQKGQPLVISPQDMRSGKGKFSELAGGSRGVRKGAPPAGWGWGEWPNRQSSVPVPAGASLRGEHVVTGNYLLDMKFNIAQHDFLPPLEAQIGGGDLDASIPVSWKPVRGAVGYFAYAMAANQAKKETIIWTSSSRPSMGIQGHEHSARIKELVKAGIVMKPDANDCDIPAGIFAGCEGVFVMAHAWGEDYWMSYPPKPAGAPRNWKPDWSVSALFVSSWSGIPGMNLDKMMRGRESTPESGENDNSAPKTGRGGLKDKQKSSPGIRLPFPSVRF
jgi:hypothetical protein